VVISHRCDMAPERQSLCSPSCVCGRCTHAPNRILLVVVDVEGDGFPERHDVHIIPQLKLVTELVAPMGIECVVAKLNSTKPFDPTQKNGNQLCRMNPNGCGRRHLNAANFLLRMENKAAQLHVPVDDDDHQVDRADGRVHTIYIVPCDMYTTQPKDIGCIEQLSHWFWSASVWTTYRTCDPLDVDPVQSVTSSLVRYVCNKVYPSVEQCASPECFAAQWCPMFMCPCCMNRLHAERGIDARVALETIRDVLLRRNPPYASKCIAELDVRLADLSAQLADPAPEDNGIEQPVDPAEPHEENDGAEADQDSEVDQSSEDEAQWEELCMKQQELMQSQEKLVDSRQETIRQLQDEITHLKNETIRQLQEEIVELKTRTTPSCADDSLERADEPMTDLRVPFALQRETIRILEEHVTNLQDNTIRKLQEEIIELKNQTTPSFADYWMQHSNAPTELKVCGVTFTPTMCYRATVDLDASCHSAWFKLGQAGGDDAYSAIECFEKAAELVPENYVYNCSLVLHGGATVRGCSTPAPQCILKAIRLVPSSDASLIKFRIDCWLKLGSLGGCGPHTRTQCYEEALKLDADNADAWAQLADLEGCEYGGVQYTAVDCCDRALTIDRGRTSVWQRLAELGGGLVDGVYHNPSKCWRLSLVESTEHPTPKQFSERWFGLSETCGDHKERKACVERALDVDQSGDGDSRYWGALYECGGGTARGKVWTFWQCLDMAVRCYPLQERYREIQLTLLKEFARDDRVMKMARELREASQCADDSSDDELDIEPATKRLCTETASLAAV